MQHHRDLSAQEVGRIYLPTVRSTGHDEQSLPRSDKNPVAHLFRSVCPLSEFPNIRQSKESHHRPLSTRKSLNDVDSIILLDEVRQAIAIANSAIVDKDRHMLSHAALIIKHITF